MKDFYNQAVRHKDLLEEFQKLDTDYQTARTTFLSIRTKRNAVRSELLELVNELMRCVKKSDEEDDDLLEDSPKASKEALSEKPPRAFRKDGILVRVLQDAQSFGEVGATSHQLNVDSAYFNYWIKQGYFRRSGVARAFRYHITPKGIERISARTRLNSNLSGA